MTWNNNKQNDSFYLFRLLLDKAIIKPTFGKFMFIVLALINSAINGKYPYDTFSIAHLLGVDFYLIYFYNPIEYVI